MKRHSMFQIILLGVFGSLAVAGVLIFAFAVGGNKSGAGVGKVVIWGTLDQNAFNVVLDEASQADQGLLQVSYVRKEAASFEQDLSDALAQKTGPDLFILSSDYAVKDEPKVLSIPYDQLTKVTFQSVFAESANVYLGPEGVVAIPFAIDPLVLYWNRDILAGAGYAEPPKYWDDVQQMASQITVRDISGGITRSAIALGTYRNVGNAKADLAVLLMQKGVAITARDAEGKLLSALSPRGTGGTTQPAVEALTFYTGFADPSQNYYSWNGAIQDARAAFAAGDAAIYVGYASEAIRIASMNPNLNFAMADIPQFRDAPRISTFGRVYAFAVPRVAVNQQGAFIAAQLLGTSSTTAAFAKALGIASARRDTLGQSAPGYGTLINRMAIITRTWADPDPEQTGDLFRAMIESAVSGAASLSQAVQQGDAQMQHIIGQ